jgi:hypothetical protein
MSIVEDKTVYFVQLKAWSKALAEALEKHISSCILDLPNDDPEDHEKERPRHKVERLVQQIGEIHATILREVYDDPQIKRQALINLLSEMHVDHATEVATLCGCTFHDFDKDHPCFNEVPSLQPQLFELCKDELM